MIKAKQTWGTIALANLSIVAFLGFTLRSKILFPLKGVDFKHILHAHSHFAFGGWVTLALLALMTYEILPETESGKSIYKWLLAGILINAAGMLVAFLWQGYAFYSILFSTLFIFITYGYSFIFIKDLLKTKQGKAVSILSISAFTYLSISSVGPFTLAYLMASHSGNNLLFRDAIYTYLHFQYNGFFTLGVFALLINVLQKKISKIEQDRITRFAIILSISIIPSLFISYLWHFPDVLIRTIAILGCASIIIMIVYLFGFIKTIKPYIKTIHPFIKNIGSLALIAFIIKSILQMGTIIPWLGKLVFGDRAVIIGYIHLVLLGFISLYLLSHMLYNKVLDVSNKLTQLALIVFVTGIIANETILMVQGFGNMLMIGNSIYSWLLWGASIVLFTGAFLIVISRIVYPAGSNERVPDNEFEIIQTQFSQS